MITFFKRYYYKNVCKHYIVDYCKSEKKINMPEVMVKALRADKIMTDKIIANIESNQLTTQFDKISPIKCKNDS